MSEQTRTDKGKKPKPEKDGAVTRRKVITEEFLDPSGVPDDKENLGGFDEIEDTRDFTGYDASLRSYMEASGGIKDFTATLYKYDNVNKQKQYVCHSSQSEMMSMHDVGMAFGSGEYRYLVTFPPETKIAPKAYKFNIHPVYDTYRQREGREVLPDPRGNGHSAMTEAMALMKGMIEIIRPMIPTPAPTANDPTQALLSNYAMVKEILKGNLRENVGLYRELAQAQAGGENEGGNVDTIEKVPSLAETIMQLVDKFAPLLIGKPALAQSAILQGAQAIPDVAHTIKQLKAPGHIADLKKVIAALEKKYGAGEIDKVLKGLGIKRPA